MLGHLFPLVPVLEELQRRGHDVCLRTCAPQLETMRRRGVDATAIHPDIEAIEMDDWRGRTKLSRQERATRVFLSRARQEPEDLRKAIERTRPDAVLVDIAAWGALAAAEAWGGRWACFSPFLLPLPSAHAPPFGPGLRPADGILGGVRDRLLERALIRGFDRLTLPTLNDLRRSLSLPPLTHGYKMFTRPPLVLAMTAEPFEYPHPDWPPSAVMVGPCAWDPPHELPQELASVEIPLVLVTTSSDFQDDGQLVNCALQGLAEGDFRLVVTSPLARINPSRVPANATVLDFAPHRPLLERASCAITHGGMGVTQKALGLGVPVCAVPFGRDQFEVARRVEFAEAGSRLPGRRLNPARLRAKVNEAIGKREGAEQIARAFAATGGAKAAVDAFEERLGLAGDA